MRLTNKMVGLAFIVTFVLAILLFLALLLKHYLLEKNVAYQFVEGPHMFYTNDGIVAQTIYFVDGLASIDTVSYSKVQVSPLQITLEIPKTNDQIDIQLKDLALQDGYIYAEPEKIVVISDLEGNFLSLKNLLLHNDIINTDFEWTFGENHLVILGDVFDRGSEVTECLWLIYHLENEAQKYGGKVHLILGNHEVMVMTGDLRYTRRKYEKISDVLKKPYSDLFSDQTFLGKWLRTKPCVIHIGDALFSHAGISPALSQTYNIDTINQVLKAYLSRDDFSQYASSYSVILGQNGPFWYRGYFDGSIDQSTVEEVLDKINANYMVVGHTVVKKITPLYNNKVIAVDIVRKNGAEYSALLVSQGHFFTVDERGNQKKL